MRYDPAKIEKKWQSKWLKNGTYEPDLKSARKPFYNLMMFPYPSAEGLHVGNVYAFTGSDIYGRFRRMKGYDVFEPIGLDGFGIHSENYALKIGAHPMKRAKVSEKNFYRQLAMIGNGFAWREKLETYDPEYYRWTQWIFAEMFKRGLAYRKKAKVNWCPSCKTVLADEQAASGKCERCGSEVVKKDLEQWFFKITDYAGRLLSNLDKINWSEKIKIAQRNWIGKSEGATLKFPISPPEADQPRADNSQFLIEVFTTRPDTLFGATYMVLAPEHPLIEKIKSQISNIKEVEKYVKTAAKKSEVERTAETKEKTGVELKGVKAVNPATKEEIPVWVADYVLAGYGTGAIMAVPAHDERDFAFAKKYKLPVVQVIQKKDFAVRSYLMGAKNISDDELTRLGVVVVEKTKNNDRKIEIPRRSLGAYEKLIRDKLGRGFWNEYLSNDIVFIFKHKSGRTERIALDLKTEDKIDQLAAQFCGEELNRIGVWGWLAENSFYTDLILHTERGILVNSGKFSGMDSEKAKWEITKFAGGKRTAQYRLRDWLISRQRYWGPPIPMIHCEKCASDKKGQRKDMPGWYPAPEKDLPVRLPFVKDFRPRGKGESPLASMRSFYEVRCPSCRSKARRETDVSDTFLDSAWYFLRYPSVRAKNSKFKIRNLELEIPWNQEILRRWLPVDMYIGGAEHSVLHLLYSRFLTMVFRDMGLTNFDEPFVRFRAHGLIVKDGAKMSKSKGNVVNPDEYIRAYGADALRLYLMFTGPFQEGGGFRDAGMAGMTRFFQRVWRFYTESQAGAGSKDIVRLLNQTIKKVTEDIESLQYNTAISALMILLNAFEADPLKVPQASRKMFLQLLAPFAPHIAEEIWAREAGQGSIHRSKWPSYDKRAIAVSEIELVIQVNGKVRGKVLLPKGVSEESARKEIAKKIEIAKYLSGEPKRVIFVPDRLINFVF